MVESNDGRPPAEGSACSAAGRPIVGDNLVRGSFEGTCPRAGAAACGLADCDAAEKVGKAPGFGAGSGLAAVPAATLSFAGFPAGVGADAIGLAATGLLLNRMAVFALGATAVAAGAVEDGAVAACGEFAGGVVMVRLAVAAVADLSVGFAGVSAFAVVVQPPADPRGSSSQVEKLAAAPW